MGELLASLHQAEHVLASSFNKGGPSWESQDRHHLAQVEYSRQRYDLDRFSILRSHSISRETGL